MRDMTVEIYRVPLSLSPIQVHIQKGNPKAFLVSLNRRDDPVYWLVIPRKTAKELIRGAEMVKTGEVVTGESMTA